LSETASPPESPPRRRFTPATGPGWIMLVSMLAVLLVAGLGLVTRYGVNTAPGLLFLEARVSGLKLGRYGKLKIEGVKGDVWRDFTVRRLTISDEKGVWLDASDVAVSWRYQELFIRRFHADRITAGEVRVLKRPTLTPKTTSRGLPVSVRIESVRLPVETLAAFSYRRGLFSLAGALDVMRKGPAHVDLAIASRLHAGDRASLTLDSGGGRPLVLAADRPGEARGGAIAGSLGLRSDQPFSLKARANRVKGVGQFSLLATSGATTITDCP